MAKNIVSLNIDGSAYSCRPYVECTTAAATAAKTVTYDGFSLVTGATILVKFTNGNSASNPTLNVNSTGAKSINWNGNNIASSSIIKSYTVYELVYDGSYWRLLGGVDTNTTYSAATTSAAGLMSAADKTKLDGITASADSVSFTQSLTSGTKVGTITINGTGTDVYCQTNTNTHYTTGIAAGESGATTNAAATDPYIAVRDDSTYRSQVRLVGGGATTISSDASGNITISSTDTNTNTNYYPTAFAWTAGTTSGPTGSLTGSGMTAVSFGAIPAASGTASGIVTTGAQTFAGAKTFSSNITILAQNTDKFINFKYSITDLDNYSWRVGYIGSGAGDANNFAIQTNKTGAWVSALEFTLPGAATFSSSVSATSFIENGTALSEKYQAKGTYLTSQDHYKTSVTAGTAGTSSATSGETLAVPYVTVNANGHVTGYGTHTHTISGFLTAETYTGTVTSVGTGAGLTGGAITSSGTIKCNLNSETSLGTIGTTSKLYAVGVDVNNKLCVNVPWTDNNTNYYPIRSYTSGLQISTYSGSTNCQLYVPIAAADTLGAVKGFHRTSGSATGTKTTTATNAPAIAARTTTSGRYYGVETDANGYMFVNVPWSTGSDINVTTTATTSTTFYVAGSSSSTTATGTLYKGAGVKVQSGTSLYASGGFYESSDERLKNFYNDVEVDLDKIAALPKKYFAWKDDKSQELHIGTSAQAVQELYPDLVSESTDDGYLNVDYAKLSVIALKAVDILNEKVKSMESRLDTIESLLNK